MAVGRFCGVERRMTDLGMKCVGAWMEALADGEMELRAKKEADLAADVPNRLASWNMVLWKSYRPGY